MDEKEKLKVVIVDDHPVSRIGLETVLSKSTDFEIVSILQSTSDLEKILTKNKIDFTLLDIDLPGTSGLEFLKKYRKNFPDTKFVLFTVHEGEGYYREAITYGANGYILKSEDIGKLTETLSSIKDGVFYTSNEFKKFQLENDSKPSLTSKEHEVLVMLTSGLTAPEISDRLGITERTVYYYNNRLKEKFDAENLIELINTARVKYFQ
ncbi:MAG: response regulator transcription factor [Leptospiraceae bacterium]|nr:response regulator transcription factor [Leptospiraceae bacterium]